MTCEWLFVYAPGFHTNQAQLLPHCTQNHALFTSVARADHQHTEMDAMFETAATDHRTSGCHRICLRGRLVIGEITTSLKRR